MSDERINVNGVEYVRSDLAGPEPAEGARAVVVVDRGWIFAGDVSESEDGERLVLQRAVWVFRWQSIGFNGVLSDPNSDKADIRRLNHCVEVPKAAVIFRVPVADGWAL